MSSIAEEPLKAEALRRCAGDTARMRRVAKAMTIQTLILSRTKFDSRAAASQWVRDHGFSVSFGGQRGPDETSTSFRFRQHAPGDFKPNSMRTIDITDGVKAVVGELKNPPRKN